MSKQTLKDKKEINRHIAWLMMNQYSQMAYNLVKSNEVDLPFMLSGDTPHMMYTICQNNIKADFANFKAEQNIECEKLSRADTKAIINMTLYFHERFVVPHILRILSDDDTYWKLKIDWEAR
ncbi:hypothetical protein [Cedecea neteri]|uniref:Uncharacterized protein n=1 Tax=Cedecea neteri TaxID=158822 RepID=A0A291DZX9_9ENTR|nr:hypothetical protein [Cedecea neteri]ATF93367.1 hypothetical protein CO704_15255 [Cedecea neteri]